MLRSTSHSYRSSTHGTDKRQRRTPRPRRRALPAVCETMERRYLLATVAPGFATDVAFGGNIASGTTLEFSPDGRLFVLTQNGTVRIIEPNGNLLATPALTLTVDSFFERGLLGIAFDPAFGQSNNHLYLYYTVPSAQGGPFNRISRFEINGNTINPASEIEILRLNQLNAGNHNGGAIHFGADGMLYAAVGENAVSSNSQTVTNLLGKMLRIDPSSFVPGMPESVIPSDNPSSFIVRQGGVDVTVMPTGMNRAIWAVGLRNPYTFAVQPGTGRMHINDVGQNTWEEINLGGAGLNYGWPATEGPFNQPSFPNFTHPLYWYPNDATTSAVVGGAFYNPEYHQFPSEYTGDYFFADLSGGWIRRLDAANAYAFQSTGGVSNGPNFLQGGSTITDLRVGPDGALYFLQRGGGNGGAGVRVVRTINPHVMDSQFQFSGSTLPSAPHQLHFRFTNSVGPSIGADDLVLENLTTSTTVPTGSIAVSYDSTTNTATFTFPGFADGILPDGNYRATLPAAGITDPEGDPLAADHVFNFFFMQGDANHDGIVNLTDFNVLAQNFGQSGRFFAQGDFNYDGTVNLADFNILASRFGTMLSAGRPMSVASAGADRAGAFSDTRVEDRDAKDDPVDALLA